MSVMRSMAASAHRRGRSHPPQVGRDRGCRTLDETTVVINGAARAKRTPRAPAAPGQSTMSAAATCEERKVPAPRSGSMVHAMIPRLVPQILFAQRWQHVKRGRICCDLGVERGAMPELERARTAQPVAVQSIEDSENQDAASAGTSRLPKP